MIAELKTQMANLKKEDNNNEKRDSNTTSRRCVYNRRDVSRSPRRGHGSPQRRPEGQQGGFKRKYQNSRPNPIENRRFTRDQTEERRDFKHNRGSSGMNQTNRDHHHKNWNGHNNKRPYINKKERELPAPSKNENFPQMVKLINRAISIRHHAQNWKTLPAKLSTQLDEFIEGVRPPAPNETLRQHLKTITENYKIEIEKAVRQHLGLALYQTGEELSKMEKLDVDRAKTTASKQIQMHLRNKIGEEDVNHWSKLAADLVGTHPSVEKRNDEPTEKKSKPNTHTEINTETEELMSIKVKTNEAQKPNRAKIRNWSSTTTKFQRRLAQQNQER